MAVTKLVKADVDGDVVDYSGRKLATKQSVTDAVAALAGKADASALASKADSSALTTVSNAVGTITGLLTTAKSSVVLAINELYNSRVRFDNATQGLTTTQQGNARTNIAAAASSHAHAASEVTFTPAGSLTATDVQAAIVQASTLGGGTPSASAMEAYLASTLTPRELFAASGGSAAYGARPATSRPVHFYGVNPPTTDGSTAGGGGMVPNLDQWFSWQAQ